MSKNKINSQAKTVNHKTQVKQKHRGQRLNFCSKLVSFLVYPMIPEFSVHLCCGRDTEIPNQMNQNHGNALLLLIFYLFHGSFSVLEVETCLSHIVLLANPARSPVYPLPGVIWWVWFDNQISNFCCGGWETEQGKQ